MRKVVDMEARHRPRDGLALWLHGSRYKHLKQRQDSHLLGSDPLQTLKTGDNDLNLNLQTGDNDLSLNLPNPLPSVPPLPFP